LATSFVPAPAPRAPTCTTEPSDSRIGRTRSKYSSLAAREHGFLFDTVKMPLNVKDAHYRGFGKLVLPELVKQGTGVLGMKPMANGLILKSKTVSPIECLRRRR
jgi:hypothetical protein